MKQLRFIAKARCDFDGHTLKNGYEATDEIRQFQDARIFL
jgi:hypothetical protein